MTRIAIIEDDLVTSNQFAQWIRQELPDVEVRQIYTRETALAAITAERFDAVVLDIQLGVDPVAGIQILHRLTSVPVLVASGLADPALWRNVMRALDAWEYIVKPVPMPVFIESVKALLAVRREPPAFPGPPAAAGLTIGALSIDPTVPGCVTWRGKRIHLTLTGLRILWILVQNAGQVVSYAQLYPAILSGRNEANVQVHISQNRSAFRDVDPAFSMIETVPLRGFRWRVR